MLLLVGILLVLVLAGVIIYKVTKKSVVLDAEGTKFEIKSKGTRIYVTINDEFTIYKIMPQLVWGETATIQVPDPSNKYDEEGNVIGEAKTRQYDLFVKSNYFGNKLFVTIYDENKKIVATNQENNQTKK